MNSGFANFLALGMFLAVNAPAQETPAQRLTIWLIDYAGIAGTELAPAENEAGRILERAGIGAEWVHCPTSAEEIGGYPECQRLPEFAALVMRIRPRSMASGVGKRSRVFGRSLIPENGEPAKYGEVYSDGAVFLANGRKSLGPSMLGHLLAHEIGHLMLGTERHSSSGIMRCPWNGADLTYAAQGRLLFTPKQARQMRSRLKASGET